MSHASRKEAHMLQRTGNAFTYRRPSSSSSCTIFARCSAILACSSATVVLWEALSICVIFLPTHPYADDRISRGFSIDWKCCEDLHLNGSANLIASTVGSYQSPSTSATTLPVSNNSVIGTAPRPASFCIYDANNPPLPNTILARPTGICSPYQGSVHFRNCVTRQWSYSARMCAASPFRMQQRCECLNMQQLSDVSYRHTATLHP